MSLPKATGPVESATDMLAMIGAACTQLGERALAEFDLTGKIG